MEGGDGQGGEVRTVELVPEKGCIDRVVSNFLRSLAEARYGEFVVAFNFKFNFV